MPEFVEWGALANVVVVSLLVGAGLPALFALGVRALAGPGARDDAGRRKSWRVAVAVACLSVVVAGIVTALYFLASGGH